MKLNLILFLLLFLCSCASSENKQENTEYGHNYDQFRMDIGGSNIRWYFTYGLF